MAKFNLASLLNNQPNTIPNQVHTSKTDFTVVPISVFDMEPSPNNFYAVEQIQELKTAIELAEGIKQNLLVVPIENGLYKVISGHRRRLACIALVEEGKKQYEFVPCKIEENEENARMQADREELLLILTNSQREKTDWEKVEEVRRLNTILGRYKEQEKLPGRVRDLVAEVLKTSAAQIGRLNAISNHLIPEFQGEMKAERLGVSAAYELSGLSKEQQQGAFAEYQDKGGFSIDDIKQKKEQKPSAVAESEAQLPGQLHFDEKAEQESQTLQNTIHQNEQVVSKECQKEADMGKQIDRAIAMAIRKGFDPDITALIKAALIFYKQKKGWKKS